VSAFTSADARGHSFPARRSALDRFFWTTPHWWTWLLSLAAWLAMIPHLSGAAPHCHVMRTSLRDDVTAWLLMVVAMMVPFLDRALKTVAFRSYARRRYRAQAALLLGYLGPWLVAAGPAIALHQVGWTDARAAAGVAFLASALWMTTPIHRRALAGCHRTIATAPAGWRADADAVRQGGLVGLACVVTCWPLMVACTLAGHGLAAMAGGTIVAGLERRGNSRARRLALAIVVVLGVGFLASTWLRP
jgi:hypothetical protein